MGGLLQQGTRSQGPLQLERCVGVSLLVLLGRSRPVGSGLGFRSAPKGLSRPEPIPISFSRAQNNVRNNSQSRELPDQVPLLLGWATDLRVDAGGSSASGAAAVLRETANGL